MKGDPVPDQHHISRYCPRTRLSENGDVTAACFQLRPQDAYLSVNWLEFLHLPSRNREISEIRRVLASKLSVAASALIAVLKVEEVRAHVRQESPDNRDLRVLHEPDEEHDDPSHAGIFNLRPEDDLVAELIAEKVRETHEARE